MESGAKVIDAVLMHNTWVGSGAFLNKVVADKDVTIGPDSNIGLGNIDVANRLYPEHLSTGITLIGKWASVPKGAKVGTNCIIAQGVTNNMWPEDLLLPDGETLDGPSK